MRLLLVITIAITVAACSGSLRDRAVVATNTTQSVLSAVDDVWAPIVQDEIAKNRPLDDEHYKAAMAPYQVIQDAIEEARQATQLLNLAVQTWDAQADDGAMFADVVPCVVQDIRLIRALVLGQPQAPPQLAQALAVLDGALGALARPGALCPGKKPVASFPAAADAGAAP